jgi:hypothetical protein
MSDACNSVVCASVVRASIARDRVIGPADRVTGAATGAESRGTKQFPDDASITHRPPGPWLQVAGRCPVLMIRPPHTFVVDGGTPREVVDEHC